METRELDVTSPPKRSVQVGPAEPATNENWCLHIDGLVEASLTLDRESLAAMRQEMVRPSAVQCPDGWGTSGSWFAGVPLVSLVELAHAVEEAQYVTVCAGEYAASFRIESLGRRNAIVAIVRDGAPMEWATGGPARLVVAKGACFDTVKWVESITLERDASSSTALAIVKKRRAGHLAAAAE